MKPHIGPSVQLVAVVIRACRVCGHARDINTPCEGCGNTDDPDVSDLGVIAGHYETRWKRLKWNLWQYRAAQRRIARTNEQMLRKA